MKYLNERITQQIDLGSLQEKGMYKYEVQVSDLNEGSWTTIFVGNYYNNGVRYYTFDITDICRNRKSNMHSVYTSVFDLDNNIIDIYRIIVSISGGQTVTGSEINVANVYPYPNIQPMSFEMAPSTTFFDFSSNNNYNISLLLQGNNRYRTGNNTLYLTPRYPMVDNAQDLDYNTTMTFGLTIEVGPSLQTATIFSVFAGNDYSNTTNWLGQYNLNLNYYNHTHTFFNSYAYFVNSQQGELPLSTDIWIYMRNINSGGTYQYRRIGVIEACKSRYYLLWQDRFGSYQSQPFDGKMEYSEDITNSEYISYTGRRQKYNVQVQPKWKINSGWLTEDLFPFYESIYISPILKLYDTQTQTEYDVILNDKYIEKKYVNQKSLLNIELNLEATEIQNIIY